LSVSVFFAVFGESLNNVLLFSGYEAAKAK